MVQFSSQHALTTHYIPYMFSEMLPPSHGSSEIVCSYSIFLQRSILLWGPSRLVAQCWCMYDVDCRLHRGEVEEQQRTITTQGTFPQETPPSLLSSSAYNVGLIFQRPVLEIISYCCFILLSFIVLLLFRRDILSDVEVASCLLWRLLCAQLSVVEDESL